MKGNASVASVLGPGVGESARARDSTRTEPATIRHARVVTLDMVEQHSVHGPQRPDFLDHLLDPGGHRGATPSACSEEALVRVIKAMDRPLPLLIDPVGPQTLGSAC